MNLLSESIYIGCVLGPQISGSFTDDRGGSCAIGAAFLAIGKGLEIEIYEGLDWVKAAARRFPSLSIELAPELRFQHMLPNGDHYVIECVGDMIVHLNDQLCFTREQIADVIVKNGWDCEAVLPLVSVGKEEEVFAAV